MRVYPIARDFYRWLPVLCWFQWQAQPFKNQFHLQAVVKMAYSLAYEIQVGSKPFVEGGFGYTVQSCQLCGSIRLYFSDWVSGHRFGFSAVKLTTVFGYPFRLTERFYRQPDFFLFIRIFFSKFLLYPVEKH